MARKSSSKRRSYFARAATRVRHVYRRIRARRHHKMTWGERLQRPNTGVVAPALGVGALAAPALDTTMTGSYAFDHVRNLVQTGDIGEGIQAIKAYVGGIKPQALEMVLLGLGAGAVAYVGKKTHT